jgi:putative oxygen-independent coproporphyrinogen III oxidase
VADPGADAGFGLYVHWPYCEAICPYCDFNVRRQQPIDPARWRAAFAADIAHAAQSFGAGRPPLTSVYFGGGTPALMPPDLVAGVIDIARQTLSLTPDAEVTIEANPTAAETDRFRAFREAGVNRLSLGIQSLRADALAFLGRGHSVSAAKAALARALAVFPHVTFDMIYARPGQGLADWRAELGEALALARDGGHVSLYQLTIESGTPFGKRARKGEALAAEEDLAADLYALTQDMGAAAGLPAYEVSNHARPDEESRHNHVYWRYGPYIGTGPGAHGRLSGPTGRAATEAIRDPARWLAAVERQGHGVALREDIDRRVQAEELLFMGLRLATGVTAARFHAVTGRVLSEALPDAALAPLINEGLVERDEVGLRLTTRGRPVLNAVVAALSDLLPEA